MVIITQDLAGLGNNLLLTCNFLINAAAHDYPLAVPVLGRYARYFERTAGRDECLFGTHKVRLTPDQPVPRALYRVLRLPLAEPALRRLPWLQRLLGVRLVGDLAEGEIDLNGPAYLARARGPRHLLVHEGWLYRDRLNFARNADLIRQFFRPIAPHRLAVERILAANRERADVLVGVHIRRGDYATWSNGAYFYDHATYARAMGEMRALFPAGTRVRFLLCSDEPIPAAAFADFDTGRSSDHPLEDLYAMAGCDYLLGTLSTYSSWASFYGQVPLCHLVRPSQTIASLDDFRPVQDQDNVPEPSFAGSPA